MNETKTEYELVQDVSGKPLVDRSVKTISVYGTTLNVPFLPESNCRKCFGRGFVGISNKENVVMCPKCYSPTNRAKHLHD
jgi:hypothetical protein